MPLDLNQSESETAQFAQMAAEQPIETPVEQPVVKEETQPVAEQEDAKPNTVSEDPNSVSGETKAEPAADDAEKDKPARQVDLRALLEERGKRKEMQAKYEEAQAELARLRGGQQPPQRQEAEQPTAQTDPIAIIERHEREMAEMRQARQQEAQMGEFQRTVIAKESEYLAANPEYPKMVEYLKETRVREMRDGLGFTDQQIHQALSSEAAQTAQYALANDLNPAEVFARLALAKGWKAEAPKAAAAAEAPAERLATIAAGQKAARGLGGAGGGAPSAAPTLASIAEMDGAEFDAMWKKDGPIRQLMG